MLLPLTIMMLMANVTAPAYVDCKCNSPDYDGICGIELGRYVDHKPGPQIDGRSTILVTYQPDWGSDFDQEDVAILQEDGARYRLLWSHGTVDSLSTPPPLGGSSNHATVYKWSFDTGTGQITVTGTKTVGQVLDLRTGRAAGRRRNLPREVYCYSARAGFVRCRGARA